MEKIKELGQVFTSIDIVKQMIGLISNTGNILEPSVGNGIFFNELKNCIGIEIDKEVCPNCVLNMDFFDYSIENKFDTIIGNPPYVTNKNILETTRQKLDSTILSNYSNLYLFFIEKCIKHLKDNGELIFITPIDFLKSNSSKILNQFIYEQGTIVYVDYLGDKKIWNDGIQPNVMIWKFVKNNFSRKTIYNNEYRNFTIHNGQLNFTKNIYSIPFNEHFYVKVGGVSGNNEIYEHNDGIEFVTSYTKKTNKLKKMLYNTYHPILEQHKDTLMKRCGVPSKWYNWSRNYYVSDEKRIYVNLKIRDNKPFFTNECKAYEGSVLAIFPKNQNIDLNLLCESFNQVDWKELGFYINGRMLFSNISLTNMLLPNNLFNYLEK